MSEASPLPDQGSGQKQSNPLDTLVSVVARLRAPGGCPWDWEQTHASLVKYLIEETYELVEAIEAGSPDDVLEELGDVLYQVLFHANIASTAAEDAFTIDDVAAHTTAKMVRRHPHVFGDAVASTADDVVVMWDDLKRAEKPSRVSVLDGIPMGMPSLALAEKVVGRAEKVGIYVRDVFPREGADGEAELGRRLLEIVASARRGGLDPERALRGALRDLQCEIRDSEAG